MKFRFTLLIIAAGLTLSACSFSLAADITPPPDYKSPTPAPTLGALFPPAAPDPVAGAALYAEKCAPCHGERGLGDGPQGKQLPNPVPAFGIPETARKGIPSDWYAVVTQGRIDRFMPPFSSLNEQQRWDTIAYVLTLGMAPGEIDSGKALYAAECAQCHGADGAKLKDADLSDQAFMARRSQTDLFRAISEGVVPGMPAAPQLGEDERWAVASYVRSLTFATGAATSTPEPASTSPAVPETPGASPTGTTATPSQGLTVGGSVTNGSGTALTDDLKVVLHGFEHNAANTDFTEVVTLDGAVGPDGRFGFDGVAAGSNRAFVASIDYAGTTYSSDVQVPDAGAAALDLPIIIYESTTDASALSAQQVHILLDLSKPDSVQVVEYFIVSNAGNKSVVAAGQGGPVLSFSLPAGYTNLVFEGGELGGRFVPTGDGFADTAGITPGEAGYQVGFGFDLPYTADAVEIAQPFNLNVDSVSVLAPQGVKVAGDQLVDSGPQDIQGASYQVYVARDLASGATLRFKVSGNPGQGGLVIAGSESNTSLVIGFGALGFVMIVAGVFLLIRDRRRSRDDHPEDAYAEDAGALMDAVIALDDQFRAGHISQEAYRERREELKARLKEIL